MHTPTTSRIAPSKSILKDIDSLALPDEVKKTADRIFADLELSTKKGTKRKRLVFYCLHQAYIELEHPNDPKKLADLIGMNRNEMTKALTMGSSRRTYIPSSIYRIPSDYINEYVKTIGLDTDSTGHVKGLCEEICQKDESLLEENPQLVASAILYVILTNDGMVLDVSLYATLLRVTHSGLARMIKKVNMGYNA